MYEKLFSPFKIGNVELKNRLCVTAMVTNYCTEDGYLTERWMRYHEEKAKGGWGLIIVEDYCFVPCGKGYSRIPGLYCDEQIEKNIEFTDRIHAHGAKVVCQIYHPGRQSNRFVNGGVDTVAPSAIPCPWLKQIPKELTVDEIHELVDKFGDAALRAKKAGFDGIEVHLAHGYLLFEFLSPHTNKRTDEYGGCFKNRFRIVEEVYKNIRSKVGDDFMVGTRICARDGYYGGREIYDTCELAMNLEALGFEYLNTSSGSYGDHSNYDIDTYKHGFIADDTAKLKEVVSIPVMCTNRITTGGVAESILRSGKADLIGMGRTSLADPHFPNKVQALKEETVRHCVNCNLGCYGGILGPIGEVTCLVNPEVGREYEIDEKLAAGSGGKKVLIAGGGPGGMQAALTATKLGHDVVLYETSDHLGGQFVSAAFPPAKGELALFTSWLIAELKRQNIKVIMNTAVTKELVEQEKPDVVIVAMGGSPIKPNIKGIDNPNVFPAEDVLLGKVPTGDDVVVCGGGEVGTETANAIAYRDSGKVSIVEMLPAITADLKLKDSLKEYDVAVYTSTKVMEITEDSVVVEKDDKTWSIPAKQVVLAFGYKPNNKLADELKGICDIKVIGGSCKTSNALYATRNAFEAVMSL